jgi:hypothetical protein
MIYPIKGPNGFDIVTYLPLFTVLQQISPKDFVLQQ